MGEGRTGRRWFALLGLLVLAVVARCSLFEVVLGYRSIGIVGTMTPLNALFAGLRDKELKPVTFDSGSLGFSLVVIHSALLAAITATTVVAWDGVEAILVVVAACVLAPRLGLNARPDLTARGRVEAREVPVP